MIKALYSLGLLALGASATELRTAPVGKKLFGQYIVRLKDSENLESLRTHIAAMKSMLGDDMEELFVYENLAAYGYNAYSTKLSAPALQILMKQDNIFAVEEDQVVSINECLTEKDADWGLVRTSVRNYTRGVDTTYNYPSTGDGEGVDAYIIDTGIYCENDDFTGKSTGSCSFGFSSVTEGIINPTTDETDGNGHGTHCAGTVGGQTYGVAKAVDLIAVKVLSDRGSGSTSGVIAGIDWVAGEVSKTKKPSVANLSLGGGFSQENNDAIERATQAGVTMIVAAGNDDSDACNYSPASAPSAITVGATDDSNSRAYYSNYGSCLDIFGPGSDITSAWIGSPDATNTISGTSMASPHVAGVAAKYLSADNSLSVDQLTAKVISEATKDVVSDVESGSPNLMAYASC